MAYRIDVNARYRLDPKTERALPVPPAQGEIFRRDIERAKREDAAPDAPALGERPFVVETGDTLTRIAEENYVEPADAVEMNGTLANGNGDLIHPNDVVLLPAPSPELVAASPVEADGAPAGEDVFAQGLRERGNRVEYAEPQDGLDAQAETSAMEADVEAYLQALPPEARQDAALRLSGADWTDAGPAGIAVSNAIESTGLEADATEAFAAELYAGGNALEHADAGDGIDFTREAGALSGDVEAFVAALPEGERADALQNLYDRNWTDAGPAQIAIEDAASAQGMELDPTGHNGPQVESEVRRIVDEARAGGDLPAQFQAFSQSYAEASPQVRAALLAPGYADDFIAEASTYASEPLGDFDPARDNLAKPLETFQRLDEMTEGAAPELTAELVEATMPEIERANALNQETTGSSLLGVEGVGTMLRLSERMGGTPGGDALIERFAVMGIYERNELTQAIGEGGSLQYALELTQAGGSSDTTLLEQDILPGIEQNRAATNSAVDEYSAHMEELRWRIDNLGDTMTPEQLQAAVDGYKAEQGPDWAAREDELEAAVAAQGETLLLQVSQLGNQPDASPEQQALMDAEVESILNDDRSFLAMQSALRTNPELLDSSTTLEFLGEKGRLTDRGRKLAEEVVTQLVQRDVLPRYADFVPGDEAGMTRIRDGLTEFRDGPAARLIGVTDRDMNKAIDAIEASLPAAGDTPEMIADKMTRLDQSLGELDATQRDGIRSFSTSTVPGQVLRMIGAAGAAASLYNSAQAAGTQPDVETILKSTFDAAGLWQRTVEIRSGLDLIDPDSFAARNFDSSVKPGAKFLGVVGGVFDLVNSGQAFVGGDPTMGVIHGVTGAGAITAALGTGSMLGPIGLGVTILGVGASMVVSDVRASNQYDNETSARFLAEAGLTPEASEALVDQSGDGNSPVPLLLEYAAAKGYDMENEAHRGDFVEWVNAMSGEQLATLRDNLHHTIDDFEGDATRLEETAPDDSTYTEPSSYNREVYTPYRTFLGERFDVEVGGASPNSVTQIDVALATLGIPELTQPVA